VPWYFAAAALPLTGVRLGYCNLFGIGAALLFDALLGLPLPASAKEQRNQAGPTLNPYPSTLTPQPLPLNPYPSTLTPYPSSSTLTLTPTLNLDPDTEPDPKQEGRSPGGRGQGQGGGGKGGKGKGGGKASPQRERHARWVQAGTCAVLVAYHAGIYISEQRAERSAEMALVSSA
jgi:hypothetical protein